MEITVKTKLFFFLGYSRNKVGIKKVEVPQNFGDIFAKIESLSPYFSIFINIV